MGRPDARSAQIRRPNGVTRSFQVSVNKVEPCEARLARNLFAKEFWRNALSDEPGPFRPEMPFIIGASARAGNREGLTRAASGPDWSIIGPSGTSECVRPDSDAGEEMALGESNKVICSNVDDGSFINLSRRDQIPRNQFPKPRGLLRVDLVVVGAHARPWL
jgi:hypothetical protein